MAEQSLKWNGDALSAKMKRAQIRGVNGTMALCVQDAKANHPWQNQKSDHCCQNKLNRFHDSPPRVLTPHN